MSTNVNITKATSILAELKFGLRLPSQSSISSFNTIGKQNAIFYRAKQ